MKFFRKIRRSLFEQNRLGKYLLYALGEIILVVIGILVALQINNWNEERKQQIQVETVLNVIEDNLKSDTARLNKVIVYYEELDSLIAIVLDEKLPQTYFDTINETNFKRCRTCFSLNTVVFDFYPETKGYDLLKSINIDSKSLENIQVQELSDFYKQALGRINSLREYNLNIAAENLRAREQFDWHADYSSKTYNQGFIDYFLQSQLYKNRLSTFRVIAIENYLMVLKAYQKEANRLLGEFEHKSTE